ncbi:MAG: chloride channel protein [Acidobacteriota bacterium]|nr:chloride channel protein [Acidobacteriota bacterium]
MKGTALPSNAHLRDFNADPRMLLLSLLGAMLGCAGAVLAWMLLHLIYAATNLFYYQRLSWNFASPAHNTLGWLAVLVPVAGGVVIGVMARFGSDKIRGHGMPEAIEAILMQGARIHPRVALFKPLSAAVAIGSGGPFGAEGPIIMTAGSVGSLLGQLFHLTDAERTTLLVAGAAAGMTGVFSTPLAAVLLAVELLLFEWRPRSFIPVAIAATTAGVLRRYLLAADPLFPMPLLNQPMHPGAIVAALGLGVLGGAAALLLSRAVYASEDLFEHHLPVHWMWWPAIGGVVIGLGGLIFPRALGTGYDVIASLIGGDQTWRLILGVLVVKSLIWSFSLGSGTSGGILAPLLMIGGALGALVAPFLPALQAGAWPLVGMAAVLSGAIGCPLTSAVLSVELTHNYALMLPLLAGAVTAHAFTVLFQRRSILTERLSRRGHHLSREYSVDPLESMIVSQIMQADVVASRTESTSPDGLEGIGGGHGGQGNLSSDRVREEVDAVVACLERDEEEMPTSAMAALAASAELVAFPGETLRTLAERMATGRLSVVRVIDPASGTQLGRVTLEDILLARIRSHERENRLERVRSIRLPFIRPRDAS